MSLKKCTGCNVEKELQEFSQKTKTKLHSRCKVCVRAKIREHYQKNKSYYIAKSLRHNKRYINQNRQFVWDYLKLHPCIDCNESDPVVLEFDHLRDKDKDISNMMHQAFSLERIKEEIAKCEVRCANCHRRKTAEQFNWYKDVVK